MGAKRKRNLERLLALQIPSGFGLLFLGVHAQRRRGDLGGSCRIPSAVAGPDNSVLAAPGDGLQPHAGAAAAAAGSAAVAITAAAAAAGSESAADQGLQQQDEDQR